ncbi:DUF6339 family protein [Actinomadura logoneensis]|uniref:DUF6339 family protein n=1 Tax=Actinomadura logoneensis TaxID=2293572 RepID=UPI001F405BD1|nr:DUF6339 family protein [Actinomadura logoneensis]
MTDVLPEHIRRLPDRDALRFLTEPVLLGSEEPPPSAISAASQDAGVEDRWLARPVREIFDTAMGRFADNPPRSDAWLAPRLHATLRLLRSEAAETSVWNYLALRLAPDYVLWRWGGATNKKASGPVNRNRFRGPDHTQAFARLWWAAELFRDGDDYRPVETACTNQEFFNSILRLEIIHHRCTAQALIELFSQGSVRTTREVNALSQAVNAAGSTLAYEALAPDVLPDADAYRDWLDETGMAYLPYGSLPKGPDDGRVPRPAVDALLPLFAELFVDAPVRGKAMPPPGED